LAMVGALSAAPVHAQAEHELSSHQTVSYADLDLSKEKDRKTLNRRFRHAAETACGEASGYDLATANAVRACRRMLMERFAAIRIGTMQSGASLAVASVK